MMMRDDELWERSWLHWYNAEDNEYDAEQWAMMIRISNVDHDHEYNNDEKWWTSVTIMSEEDDNDGACKQRKALTIMSMDLMGFETITSDYGKDDDEEDDDDDDDELRPWWRAMNDAELWGLLVRVVMSECEQLWSTKLMMKSVEGAQSMTMTMTMCKQQ